MSVDALVAEARTTKPTLYRRGSGKEELAIAALSRLPRTDAPEPTGDARADLVELLRDVRGSFCALYLSGEPIPANRPERAVDAIGPGLTTP